jgi:ankyrin repeat protein
MLMHAVYAGNVNLVEELLSKGANVSLTDVKIKKIKKIEKRKKCSNIGIRRPIQ